MTAGVRLAVLGDPLRHTRSPELHVAGARSIGLTCESVAIRTPPEELPATLARLAAEGYTGCNLTMPLKEPALALVNEASEPARTARSVNTITFEGGAAHGDTTDGAGFVDLLAALDRDVARVPVVLLGAGGAARSLAHALASAGAPPVRVISRRAPASEPAWGGSLAGRWAEWGSAPSGWFLESAGVLVNCTPLGHESLAELLTPLAHGTLVVDLTYGETLTDWVVAARARGLEAVDGLGLLVHQARHSLMRWFGRDVPLAALDAAVGWPR